jgi:radical SAM-linked protein
LRLKYLLRFAIEGDLRFISHKDTIRMFERLLVRSCLPVSYTEGFNPRVRLWLPLPRSVGTSAEDEVLIFQAVEELKPAPTLGRMQKESPAGLRLRSLRPLAETIRPRPVRALYEIALAPGDRSRPDCGDVDLEALDKAIERFNSSASWPIQRTAGGRRRATTRQVDLRPLVEPVHRIRDRLQFGLPVLQGGSAKPREVLAALGLPAAQWSHRLRRVRVEWNPPLAD